MRDDRWGETPPLYIGDALVDLHGGAGTAWRRTPAGAYWPDCDCHRPAGLAAAPSEPGPTIRTSERPTWASSATPTPRKAPEPVIAPLAAPDDESADAGRVLIAMLRRLAAKL